ncbi:hypothetical protein CNMCM7691_006947 [Aspergillus felis]|uniref:Uncharacterized protein n=1 Tax=Aspergillus felis TaxID=1287682 RepID=A0A8H6R2S1_9EURO|nr:hypothetical protein CNMCM7691_006947 [Aspergillus felis]
MGEDQLLYQQMAFTMGDFRGFIHGLVTAAREILGQLCMQDHAQMPPIPWTWPVDGTHWMISRLRAEPAMQRHFMRGGRFHPSAIQQYWQRVAQFKEKLAIMLAAWQAAQAALGIQAVQGSQAAQAWLWGPDPGTGREWSSERFREVLKQETRTRLGTAIHIAAYWDIAIGISRRFLRPSTAFPHNI